MLPLMLSGCFLSGGRFFNALTEKTANAVCQQAVTFRNSGNCDPKHCWIHWLSLTPNQHSDQELLSNKRNYRESGWIVLMMIYEVSVHTLTKLMNPMGQMPNIFGNGKYLLPAIAELEDYCSLELWKNSQKGAERRQDFAFTSANLCYRLQQI